MGIQASDGAEDVERQPLPQAPPPPISGASALSDIIVGAMMGLFAVIGLIEAFGAVDNEMFVFGVSLFAFGCVFIVGLVRGRFRSREAAGKAAGSMRHG